MVQLCGAVYLMETRLESWNDIFAIEEEIKLFKIDVFKKFGGERRKKNWTKKGEQGQVACLIGITDDFQKEKKISMGKKKFNM